MVGREYGSLLELQGSGGYVGWTNEKGAWRLNVAKRVAAQLTRSLGS